MRRSWVGFGLLILLLLAAIVGSVSMAGVHRLPAQALEQGARAALEGDWPQARAALQRSRLAWEKARLLRSCLWDHGPAEEIQADFAVLETYGRLEDAAAFAALSRQLGEKIAALGDAHRVTAGNVF